MKIGQCCRKEDDRASFRARFWVRVQICASKTALAVALAAALSSIANAQVVEANQKSVVRVISKAPEGVERTGTGFVVKVEDDTIFILTAAHVVKGDDKPRIELFTRRNRALSTEKKYEDDRLDVALLVLTEKGIGGLPALPFDTGDLRKGDELWTIGFPSGLSWDVKKLIFSTQDGSQLVLSDKVDSGASGAPLLREGKVVGMITEHREQRGRATPALSLRFNLRDWIGLDSMIAVSPTSARDAEPSGRAGKTFKDCATCPEMIEIPAGSFAMGSSQSEPGRFDDEGPSHEVTIPKAIAVSKFEISRGQFRRFQRATGWKPSGGCYVWEGKEAKLGDERTWENPGFEQTDEHPVVCVSYQDAQLFVQWISKETKHSYRLLSEAEWEYAARAGLADPRYWGNSLKQACDYANVADRTSHQKYTSNTSFECDDGYAETAPTGKFKPNAFGLYDTLGNVWELVEDCYARSYEGAPIDGTARSVQKCASRLSRGGSWIDGPNNVRSAIRNAIESSDRISDLGFRVGRSLP